MRAQGAKKGVSRLVQPRGKSLHRRIAEFGSLKVTSAITIRRNYPRGHVANWRRIETSE